MGNFFLLMNFTHRIRYIVALPITIVLWYIATAIVCSGSNKPAPIEQWNILTLPQLITITAALHIHEPAVEPDQAYTQGYWYAVISAVLYLMCSMMLMINMLGYFLGHYPEHFSLTDHQRTLILQTMLFFIWLGGGAAAFGRVATAHGEDGWSFVNSVRLPVHCSLPPRLIMAS